MASCETRCRACPGTPGSVSLRRANDSALHILRRINAFALLTSDDSCCCSSALHYNTCYVCVCMCYVCCDQSTYDGGLDKLQIRPKSLQRRYNYDSTSRLDNDQNYSKQRSPRGLTDADLFPILKTSKWPQNPNSSLPSWCVPVHPGSKSVTETYRGQNFSMSKFFPDFADEIIMT